MRGVALAVGAVALALVAVGGIYAFRQGVGPLADPTRCTATTAERSVALSTEQAENASIIAAVAQRRNLPARAVTIAFATAYQESDLENLESGDRDSLGLFQQRPSQGWGRPRQIMNPYYATNAFYDALVEINGYQTMRVTEAAQTVQRSAFPEAYADHEQDSRVLASALTGYSPHTFACVVEPADVPAQREGDNGLTGRAEALRLDLVKSFGRLSMGGFQPGGVSTGHTEGSAHYEGRAIDVFFRPIEEDNIRSGWVLAHYLVASPERLSIEHIIFDDRIWTSGDRSEEGWRNYSPPNLGADAAAETRNILEHRDHVHVDVA
ncbi:MAG: hypothetical protein ACR2GB_03260 [Nocardioidaceae bacterium]